MYRHEFQMTLALGAQPAEGTAAERGHGEVFTRRWVVELILDLAGYTADRDLAAMVAVEPSCGVGAFLGPMIDRVIASCGRHGRHADEAVDALRAFDLVGANVELARKHATQQLVDHGVAFEDAEKLARGWVTQDDFILHSHDEVSADFVLGNPPYIRLENLPADRNVAYRQACPTMRGRSDIFIAFIELGLRLLKPGGALGFIVADRWMRNQYGASLRSLVTDDFSVEAVVEMHDVDAFEEAVSAYPAVTVIRRQGQGSAILASTTGAFGEREAGALRTWAARHRMATLALPSVRAARLPGWFSGDESWPSGTPEQLAIVADLEGRCPPLEDPRTGTRVGIGLASGADDIYLTNEADVVESERLLPLVMARDLAGGRVAWSGTYLINPWDDDGLVDIDDWPRFRAYLERHGDRVKGRHTARKTPQRWYKTIDRVTAGLLQRPKLLLPEMKASAHPVLDEGTYYPHHNLYHVTSTGWDLEVLGGIMLSEVANLFVGTYCVKMRGGCYRFQAQYLRRIRVPAIDSLKSSDRRALAKAFECRDVEAATAAALKLYGLSEIPTQSGVAERASA